LLLRAWQPDDAAELAPILAANEARLLPWIPSHVATSAPVRELRERLAGFAADFAGERSFRYAMRMLSDGRLLGELSMFPRNAEGRCSLADGDRVEIGYWIDAAAERKGIVTEAVSAMIEVAMALRGMSHVEIRCSPANARSAAVPRKLGFRIEHEDSEVQLWQND
jgi:RimJ/RimL family protein N-acetyltransferase